MLLDAHAHLDAYQDEIGAVLQEITDLGVLTLAVAVDLPSWQRCQELGERCRLIVPTFGIHPARAAAFKGALTDLLPAIDMSPMVGEIGLDYHWVKDASQYPAQRRVFDFFLGEAAEQSLIVNLHTKGAESDILAALRASGVDRSIIHWYSGPLELIEPLLEAGAWFTFGSEILLSEHIRNILAQVPLERILTETDNPGGHRWLTGETGMPHHLLAVIDEIARLRSVDVITMRQQVWRNFSQLVHGNSAMQAALRRAGVKLEPAINRS